MTATLSVPTTADMAAADIPEAAEAAAFLTRLHGPGQVPAGSTIELRAFQRGTEQVQRFWYDTPEAAAAAALALAPKYNVYFGVCLRRPNGSAKSDVTRIPALWADIDFKNMPPADAYTRLENLRLPPSLVVESGGGLHVYWLLDNPLPATPANVQAVESVMRRLHTEIGSDRVHDVGRILRVPGTLNHKYTPARNVYAAMDTAEARYRLADFLAILPPEPAPAPTHTSGDERYSPLSVEQVRDMLAHIPPRMDYADWLNVCLAVKAALPGDEGAALVSAWSPRLDAAGNDITLDWWHRTQPESVTPGTLVYYAKRYGWQPKQGAKVVIEGQPAQLPALIQPAQTVPGQRIGTRLSDVQPEQVSWLWPGRIPYGKLTVLDGAPGAGKSTLALEIAARLSTGQPMPDGTATTAAGAIIVRPEDGVADTLKPRLLAAGADDSRILVIETVSDVRGEHLFFVPADIPTLEAAIQQEQARLVIIDSLMSVLPAALNSYRDQDMRAALAPLEALAQRTGAAILAIRHLTKAVDRPALYSGGGSIGIIGVARSGLLAARHPDDESIFVLASTKSNLGPAPASVRYQIVPAGQYSRIAWLGEDSITADELTARPNTNERRITREEARSLLTLHLDGQCAPATALYAAAQAARISPRTLDRAKKELAIESRRRAFGGPSYWCLPGVSLDDDQAA